METINETEFMRLLRAQGVPREDLAFICPMCGTVQSARDLIDAGAGKSFNEVEKFLAFSCVGRWTHAMPPPKEKGTQKGCDWTLGGLFPCHNLKVKYDDGAERPLFDIAAPEQAQRHIEERRNER